MTKSISFLTAAVLALPASVWADVHTYVAMPLTASQESTAPNSSGYGSVTALYDIVTRTLVLYTVPSIS